MIRLKELRTNAGLSQSEFAKKMRVAQNTVSNWENGNRLLDSENINRICDYFGCTSDYLLGRVDEPNIEIKKVPSEDGTTELDIGVSKGTDLTQDEITALRELLKKNKQGQ